MNLLRAILRELHRPYGYAGMVLSIGLLLILGVILYRVGRLIAGWWG